MSIKRDGNVLPVDDVATTRFHSDLARPSTATPIWWIPNETLLHIVEIGHTLQLMDSSLNSEPSLPFAMSHVSRTFRMLTTSQPSLWSTFSFSSPHQMGVLKQHLGRSKSSLLDIRINLATFMFQYGKSEQDALDVLDLVMDHYNRWQSFKISCNVVAARYFTSFLQGHTIPVLEKMYLRLHDIDGNHSIHPPIAGDCLPSLRSARLDCLGPHSFSVPPAALQELILDNVPFSMMRQMTLCRFRDFINAMPSLQRLFLHLCVINNIELMNVGARIHAPSLLSLVLYTEYAGVGFLAHLLAIMSAPHLESLSLVYLEDEDFKDADVNLLPKFPSIRTLTMKRAKFGQNSTLHYLRNLPFRYAFRYGFLHGHLPNASMPVRTKK